MAAKNFEDLTTKRKVDAGEKKIWEQENLKLKN